MNWERVSMKKRHAIALAITLSAAMVSGTPAQQAPPSSPQAEAVVLGMDDLMTMLVQPRHVRLYYAGKAQNWELAAAEARNLRNSLTHIAAGIPTYLGNDVNQAVTGFLTPSLSAVDTAIAMADAAAFTKAYGQVTDGCNACHTYMERPFLVIKAPGGDADTAHPDQDYRPVP